MGAKGVVLKNFTQRQACLDEIFQDWPQEASLHWVASAGMSDLSWDNLIRFLHVRPLLCG